MVAVSTTEKISLLGILRFAAGVEVQFLFKKKKKKNQIRQNSEKSSVQNPFKYPR